MHSHLHLYNLLSGLSLEHLPCYPNQTADPPPCAHQHPDHCQSSWELLQPGFGKFLKNIISLLVSFASPLIQALDKPTVFYKAVMTSSHDTTLVCLKFYKSSSLHVVMPLRKRCLSMRKVQGHSWGQVESCTSDFLCPCQAVHGKRHSLQYVVRPALCTIQMNLSSQYRLKMQSWTDPLGTPMNISLRLGVLAFL